MNVIASSKVRPKIILRLSWRNFAYITQLLRWSTRFLDVCILHFPFFIFSSLTIVIRQLTLLSENNSSENIPKRPVEVNSWMSIQSLAFFRRRFCGIYYTLCETCHSISVLGAHLSKVIAMAFERNTILNDTAQAEPCTCSHSNHAKAQYFISGTGWKHCLSQGMGEYSASSPPSKWMSKFGNYY